jgi:endo-1,3(4)-beta-glucanase
VVHSLHVIQNEELSNIGLRKLKEVVNTWASNRQKHYLVYEKTWGGIVTSWALNSNNLGLDFGNAIYNDHHFHYGYWVYAASVIARMDLAWLSSDEGKIAKLWINALIRDYANPVYTDEFYPFSRAFDWYHGHSWATGIDPLQDGKNEESTSEDSFSLYAMKLWGYVTENAAMEARANLQLAILKRSLHHYFLMENDNKNHPAKFIGNKVTGIVSTDSPSLIELTEKLFENKVHHTTFFGNRLEYIHGIHMLPVSPVSAYTRSKKFTSEEWDKHFANYTPEDKAWKSLLMGSAAIIQPQQSFDFFASNNFQRDFIGNGESRAYYLFYSSVLANMWV